MAFFPLDSNQPALTSSRLGLARLATFRLGAPLSPRNLTPSGENAWTRIRAVNPTHNVPASTSTWTTVKAV